MNACDTQEGAGGGVEQQLPPLVEEPPGAQPEAPEEAVQEEAQEVTAPLGTSGQEIQREDIKETLKEIITEIEQAVVAEPADTQVMAATPAVVEEA